MDTWKPAGHDIRNRTNCNSQAWHGGQGDQDATNDPTGHPQPKGEPLVDNSPRDDMEDSEQVTENAQVGDKLVYGVDKNGNGTFEEGEITHSANALIIWDGKILLAWSQWGAGGYPYMLSRLLV